MDGEFDNVRDAERAAGIIPPKVERKQVWLPVGDMEKAAAKLKDKFGPEWCLQLAEHLKQQKKKWKSGGPGVSSV